MAEDSSGEGREGKHGASRSSGARSDGRVETVKADCGWRRPILVAGGVGGGGGGGVSCLLRGLSGEPRTARKGSDSADGARASRRRP